MRVFGEVPMDLQGCGRTDAGVHALEYVAHLEVAADMGPHEVARKLNETLPKDIAVKLVEAAGLRFHARHNCIARSYIYISSAQKNRPLANGMTGGCKQSWLCLLCSMPDR